MNEQLKKEVETLQSQGYTEPQIKAAMTDKGYTIKEIEEAIKSPPVSKSDKNKTLHIIIISILVLIIISAAVFLLIKSEWLKYSDSPKNWVIQNDDGTKSIDITQATKGAGYTDEIGLQYEKGNISTVFGFDGVYEGNIFTTSDYIINNTVLLRISKDQLPKDSIPEIYILERIDGNKVTAYIFVDSDWKNIFGDSTNIMWGAEYENMKKLEYKPLSEGLYYDTFDDDRLRFSENFKESSGGIIVGKITKEDITSNDISKAIIVRFI